MKSSLLPLLTTALLVLPCAGQVLDFEMIDGATPTDDAVVSDQFRASHGVRFRLDTNGDGLPDSDLPRIEATGEDGTDGFVGGGSRDVAHSDFTGRLGDFFLRSHLGGTGGTRAPLSLIVLYDDPVSAVSAEIWDLDGHPDGTEQWQIDALGPRYLSANDVTDINDSVLSPLGDNHLFNAKPWTFSFDHRGTADIHALRIQFVGTKRSNIGLAFDNFATSSPDPEADACGTGLPPIRSSAYNGGGATFVRYDHQPQFNATVETTIEAWVYRDGPHTRCETILAQNFRSDLWFGLCSNLRFYRSGGSQATADRGVPVQRWTHVAVSYDGSIASFYIDGEEAGRIPLSNAGAGGNLPLQLGADPGGFPFKGCLDEVRIWSVARTAAQIQNGMFQEIRSAPGLAAVFPEGGLNESLGGLRGFAPTAPEEKAWGILPSYLVVPRVEKVTFDGRPMVATEYKGAEELPIRYDDGPDGRAYLVYTDEAGDADDKLYVGVTGLREPESPSNRSASRLGVYLDPNRSRDALARSRDFSFRSSLQGDLSDSIFGNNAGSWRGPSDLDESFLVNSFDIKSTIPAEFATPEFEFKISKPLLGALDGKKGFAIAHVNAEGLFDIDSAPSYAVTNSPVTWTCLTFGDDANRPTVRPEVVVSVRDADTGAAITGYEVRIRDAGTADILAEFTIPPSGTHRFFPTLPAGRPLVIQIPDDSNLTFLQPQIGAGFVRPIEVSPTQVRYPALTNSEELAPVTFRIQRPLPPIVFNDITPNFVTMPTVMRTTPDRKTIPSVFPLVTLTGQNFHENVEVYLYNCRDLPPIDSTSCREGVHYLRCPLISVEPDRSSMLIRVPNAPIGEWDIAIKDNGLRPGVVTPADQWTRQSSVILGLPDYPRLFGFEFENEPDDRERVVLRDWQLFSSVFQNSIYPPAGCLLPKPSYRAYFDIFKVLDRSINGTCVGFAATSELFARGELDPADFGAIYPFGIPGVESPDDDDLVPIQPDHYESRGPCRGSRPTNMWGQLRRNHLVQLSHEVIEALFDQVRGRIRDGGDPRALYERLSLSNGYVLSMTSSGSGHAVTPIRTHDGYKMSDDSMDKVESRDTWDSDPSVLRYKVIEIYDNNFPGQSRFIEIDWQTNRFQYNRGDGKGLFEGRAIFTLPISIWTHSRTRPGILRDGIEIIYELVMGDATVEHENENGKRWGWDDANEFQEDYPGAKTLFLLDGLENDTRNALFFPPPGTVPARSLIKSEGGEYFFHADQGSTLVQLQSNGVPGQSDSVELQQNGDGLCGLRFIPQQATEDTRVCLTRVFSPDQEARFDLSKIDLEGKKGLSVELLESSFGVEVKNEGSEPIAYELAIDAYDAGAAVASEQSFGEVIVPAGASQKLELTDWPNGRVVRAATDLDNDGIVETTTFLGLATPVTLDLQRNGSTLELRWPHLPGRTLRSSADLINWTPVEGIVIDGDQASYSEAITTGDGPKFFQLWE